MLIFMKQEWFLMLLCLKINSLVDLDDSVLYVSKLNGMQEKLSVVYMAD